MNVRLTARATGDLAAALAYAEQRSSLDAARLVERIEALMDRLSDFPEIGRLTSVPGVRMSRVRGLPFFVFYRIAADGVVILHIRHSARRAAGSEELR